MIQVNYKLLPKKQKQERSVGAKSVLNSFYILESHHEPYLTECNEVYVDDFFGLRFSDESHEVDSQVGQQPLLD